MNFLLLAIASNFWFGGSGFCIQLKLNARRARASYVIIRHENKYTKQAGWR
jgi:hypothetical protein